MTILDALIITLAPIGIPVGLWSREYPETDSAGTSLEGAMPAETTNPERTESA